MKMAKDLVPVKTIQVSTLSHTGPAGAGGGEPCQRDGTLENKPHASAMPRTQLMNITGRCFAHPVAAMQLFSVVTCLAVSGLSRLERWVTVVCHVQKNGHQSVSKQSRHTLVKDLLQPELGPEGRAETEGRE